MSSDNPFLKEEGDNFETYMGKLNTFTDRANQRVNEISAQIETLKTTSSTKPSVEDLVELAIKLGELDEALKVAEGKVGITRVER